MNDRMNFLKPFPHPQPQRGPRRTPLQQASRLILIPIRTTAPPTPPLPPSPAASASRLPAHLRNLDSPPRPRLLSMARRPVSPAAHKPSTIFMLSNSEPPGKPVCHVKASAETTGGASPASRGGLGWSTNYVQSLQNRHAGDRDPRRGRGTRAAHP
jgi:hypothetical protein